MRPGSERPRELRPLQMVDAAAALCDLAERGLAGVSEANAAYQARLFDLHNDTTPATDVARRWIAEQVYAVERRHVAEVDDFVFTHPRELRARFDAEIAAGSRGRHPMSRHLYEGSPSRDDLRAFLANHWLRSCMFFRLVVECALRLPDFEDWSALYLNLHDETGEGDARRAHPVLLRRLMEHYDLPADYHATTEITEEQAYLNNRVRCVREADPAWGLALLYAIEVTTSANHRSIYHMLRRAGVPEPACEFHRLHGEVDDGHAERLWELLERRAEDPAFQRTALRSLRHHFALTRSYFDVLWERMRRA